MHYEEERVKQENIELAEQAYKKREERKERRFADIREFSLYSTDEFFYEFGGYPITSEFDFTEEEVSDIDELSESGVLEEQGMRELFYIDPYCGKKIYIIDRSL